MALFDLSYSITRPYPYRWFEWVTYIGGIILLVFFTVLNLASNGYQLKVETTKDFNGTINQKRWTQHFPFNLMDKTPPTCQSLELPVDTKFWTNKLALPFTLISAWQGSSNASVYSTSLFYSNNVFQDCRVWYIQVGMDTLEMAGNELIAPWDANAVPAGTGDLAWSPRASAFVNCTIANSATPLQITLLAEYASLLAPGKKQSFPTPPDVSKSASLWWGQSLLSWYWSNLTTTSGSNFTRGAINLAPRDHEKSILDSDFFHVAGFWFRKTEGTQATTWFADMPSTIGDAGGPDIGNQVDLFAKAMYATVLADLGQHSVDFKNNALLDPKLLANLSNPINNLTTFAHGPGWINAGPAKRSYNPLVDKPLNITDSYIDHEYLCQVPVLKSWLSLLISVLVADLVLLRTAWQLLGWSTGVWLSRRDPYANYCVGCLKSGQADRKDGFEYRAIQGDE